VRRKEEKFIPVSNGNSDILHIFKDVRHKIKDTRQRSVLKEKMKDTR